VKFLTKFFEDNKQLAFFSLTYFAILILWYFYFFINNNFELIFSNYNESYYFKPYFSLYVYELLYNKDFLFLSSILSVIIIPFSSLLILFKIYKHFIDTKYAFLLSLISVSIFNETNFRDFLYNILNFNFIFFPVNDFPLIFKLPFPSLSVFIFLIILYKILKTVKFNNLNFIIITIISSLYFYINALDALFILLLWFFYIINQLIKIKKYKFVFLYISLAFILVLPGLFHSTLIQENVFRENNLYNLILYNLIPLLLSLIFFYIKRIDLYEVWFKFKFIYFFLFLEISINAIVYLKIFNLDLFILNKQVLQFGIHLLYYTPLIYYATRKPINYKFGPESNQFSKNLANIFFKILVDYKSKIFTVLIILLLIYNFPINLLYAL
jgi:hypothetical protein